MQISYDDKIAERRLCKISNFYAALRLIKIRAEAMQECSLRYHSGMITIRVNAATRLEEALHDAKTYAWFVYIAFLIVQLFMKMYCLMLNKVSIYE